MRDGSSTPRFTRVADAGPMPVRPSSRTVRKASSVTITQSPPKTAAMVSTHRVRTAVRYSHDAIRVVGLAVLTRSPPTGHRDRGRTEAGSPGSDPQQLADRRRPRERADGRFCGFGGRRGEPKRNKIREPSSFPCVLFPLNAWVAQPFGKGPHMIGQFSDHGGRSCLPTVVGTALA
jgi:hypothetical protein